MKIYVILLCLFSLSYSQKPIVLNPNCEHDKWKTLPQDHIFQFGSYTTSFDGIDDNNGDGDPDLSRIPQ